MVCACISVYRPRNGVRRKRPAGHSSLPSRMLPLVPQLRILLAVEPVDFRNYARFINMRSSAMALRRNGHLPGIVTLSG